MKTIVTPEVARFAAIAFVLLAASACGDSDFPSTTSGGSNPAVLPIVTPGSSSSSGSGGTTGGGTTGSSGGAGTSSSGATTPPIASRDDVPFPPMPDPDPFYAQPASFPDTTRGKLLDSRMVTFAPQGGVPMPNPAYHLKFVSRDVNGKLIAAVATVVLPMTPTAGVTPLLAYQYAEDSLGSQCAPSHTVTGSTENTISQMESALPLPALAMGWVLVYPDHEGPFSAYGAGRLAGQITLDAVRAALAFAPAGLTAQTPVGLWGYSGGATATAWAATLQREYAPELNIRAIASGGTPADVIGVARAVDANPVTNAAFFSLILSAILGNNRAYPQLVTPILNDRGRAAAEALKDGCGGNTTDGSANPTGMLADYTSAPDPFATPGVLEVAPKLTLPQPDSAPMADTFVYHSQIDELIPVAGADAMVADWCRKGSRVSYFRGVMGEHVAFQALTAPNALAYLASRLSAAPATVVPPTTAVCN